MKFIAILLNSSSSDKRANDIYHLLVYGYNQYQVINVARAGEKYTDFAVYKSNTPGPSTVVYKNDLNAVTRLGVTKDQLQLNYVGQSYIVGGSKKGTEVGKVEVYYQDKKLSEGSIVTSESFEKVGGFSSFIDSIALVFRNLINTVSNSVHHKTS
jgi:D-alanyl-D-alanine carboxypeptidase